MSDAAEGSAADAVLQALRSGDEAAFRSLVALHHPTMVALASHYVPSRAVAEDVAQETWLAVIEGLDRFEGRSSIKSWIFAILLNRARTRGARERRTVPRDPLGSDTGRFGEERFCGAEDRWAGHWAESLPAWSDTPAEQLSAKETLDVVVAAIGTLPLVQRQVVTLRDMEQWSATDVSELLGLTDGNQRVLLHRGRMRVRQALEAHFEAVQRL